MKTKKIIYSIVLSLILYTHISTADNSGRFNIDINELDYSGNVNLSTDYRLIDSLPYLHGDPGISSSITLYTDFPALTIPLSPVCEEFISTPSIIKEGESSVLSWDTLYAASAELNQGIGIVNPNDSLTVTPSNTRTYELTLYNEYKKSICYATVIVDEDNHGGGGGGGGTTKRLFPCKYCSFGYSLNNQDKVCGTIERIESILPFITDLYSTDGKTVYTSYEDLKAQNQMCFEDEPDDPEDPEDNDPADEPEDPEDNDPADEPEDPEVNDPADEPEDPEVNDPADEPEDPEVNGQNNEQGTSENSDTNNTYTQNSTYNISNLNKQDSSIYLDSIHQSALESNYYSDLICISEFNLRYKQFTSISDKLYWLIISILILIGVILFKEQDK